MSLPNPVGDTHLRVKRTLASQFVGKSWTEFFFSYDLRSLTLILEKPIIFFFNFLNLGEFGFCSKMQDLINMENMVTEKNKFENGK